MDSLKDIVLPVGPIPILLATYALAHFILVLKSSISFGKIVGGASVLPAYALSMTSALMASIGLETWIPGLVSTASLGFIYVFGATVFTATYLILEVIYNLFLGTSLLWVQTGIRYKINGTIKNIILFVFVAVFVFVPAIALFATELRLPPPLGRALVWDFLLGSQRFQFGALWLASGFGIFWYLLLLTSARISLSIFYGHNS